MRTCLLLLCACASLFVAAAALSVDSAVADPAPIAYAGHYVYHDRDDHLLPLLATLTCMADCSSATPSYRATLQFTSVLLGNLVLNSRLVGFGSGPAPQIIGGCSNDNFTVILEDDDFASGNIFAAYAPCNRYAGGASVYSKDMAFSLASHKSVAAPASFLSSVLPGNTTGKYLMSDRNGVLSPENVLLWCVDDCDVGTPTLRGSFGSEDEFVVTFAPDGFAGFGYITVDDAQGQPCGRAQFTVIVPPVGGSSGSPLLGAAAPLPECGYGGAAYRFANA